MNPTRFDRISRRFAERRLSRRKALVSGGAGIAGAALATTGLSAVAQDATPEAAEAEPWDGEKTTYLFVQSFHGGSIVPTEGEEGRYTVTLEQGTGQTIYFGDRPSRDVGAAPTPQFLEGLGFPDDNPPNAALIVETASGETDTAVVELFNPTYDPVSRGVTYDVAVLESWQEDLELGFREAPADLAALAPDFGSAHLLIDDCPTVNVWCNVGRGSGKRRTVASFSNVDTCWTWQLYCMPCEPYAHDGGEVCPTMQYWDDKCNRTFPDACQGECWNWPSNYVIDPGCG